MNQFILGGGDPVLAGTQIDEQIQLLEGQKQLLMARQRQMQQGAIVQQQQQLGQQPQVAQVSLWDSINAQYHDYCELFEKWFGSNFDEKIIASAVDFWFEDDDFDGNKVWKYFNEM